MKVLGVCGGNGVILHPFRDNLMGNIETRSAFVTPNDIQWDLNFSAPLDKTDQVAYRKQAVKIIIGAPDCGHSSNLALSRGKKFSDASDNKSLSSYISMVNDYQPDFFLMENLPKMRDTIGDTLDNLFPGYHLIVHVGPVSDFGNSQLTRVRLVVIGMKEKRYAKYFKVYPLSELKTSAELIEGLDKYDKELTCHVRESDDTEIPLYWGEKRKITVAKARDIWNHQLTRVTTKWPVNNGNLKNQPGVYKNLANDYPFTVRKSNRQFNHLGEQLTPREMARIQGVPDHFNLWYNKDNHGYCINKGRLTVTKSPPYEIGLWFHKCLKKLSVL